MAAEHAQTTEVLSSALLVLLETLTPAERAALLLREVFVYAYAEIAAILDRSEAACRQLAARARARLAERRSRFEVSAVEQDRLARRFFAAVEDGDMDGLVELLAADVAAHGRGAGPCRRHDLPASSSFDPCGKWEYSQDVGRQNAYDYA